MSELKKMSAMQKHDLDHLISLYNTEIKMVVNTRRRIYEAFNDESWFDPEQIEYYHKIIDALDRKHEFVYNTQKLQDWYNKVKKK